jgi:hypothetical protein
MQDRRLVGIDLGITSAHTVRVLAGDGITVCRRKAVPTVESLGEVEHAALAGTPPGSRLEVVLEPTGPAWLPIAVFFSTRGHTVYRVSSAKAHDLRRVLSRHAKSNGIDADTLARLPLVDPAGLHPLELPGAERSALDRRVRATDRLTRQAATHSGASSTWSASCCLAAHWSASSARPTWPSWSAGPTRTRWSLPDAPGWYGSSPRPPMGTSGSPGPPSGWPPPTPPSSCTATTPPSPGRTWPPRSTPRSGCCAPPRPSSTGTP